MTSDGEETAKTRCIDSNLSSQPPLLVGRPPTSRRYLRRSEAKGGRPGIFGLLQMVVRACTWMDDGLPHERLRVPGGVLLLQARDAPAKGTAGKVSL